MKITNKQTGFSFILSPKETADFFYSKNAKGKFINTSEDYNIEDTDRKISNVKFYIVCIGLVVISVSSFLLHLHLNY
tara:strand:- start:13 stop:243 length:231 start_codon:yes stop_codon:yes gene_type:complete